LFFFDIKTLYWSSYKGRD